MKVPSRACLVAALLAAAIPAFAGMSAEEYKAQKARIESDYKSAMAACKPMKGNERDVCRLEAGGNRKVGIAAVEAQYRPNPKTEAKLRSERADAALRLAMERCDGRPVPEREACRNDAKAAFVNAKS